MYVERLTHLANLLDRVYANGQLFHLGVWRWQWAHLTHSEYEHVMLSTPNANPTEHECGTVACAVGYATLDPVFNEQGLTATPCGQPMIFRVEDGHILSGWAAVRDFFDLDQMTAGHLFDSMCYPSDEEGTAMHVAQRIRRHLETGTIS